MEFKSCCLEDVREALSFLSPDCDRSTWVRYAMAIKAEFGEAGFSPWDEWSRDGASYNERAARSTWKSVKGQGGITIATLFAAAYEAGYRAPRRSEEQQAEREAAAAKRREKVRKEQERAAAMEAEKIRTCAARAAKIWGGLPDSGTSPYLDRKRVRAFGVRFSRGSVVVPVRNTEWDLVGLQFIDPDGSKVFLTGTPKSGAFHMLGSPAPSGDGEVPVIWIAEGYATAATIHQATGCAAVVAFDCWNLLPVGRCIRHLYPDATLAFAADNDADNPDNPGVNCAQKAAAELGGVVWVPQWPSQEAA